jgi:hypothetical protein
MYTHETVKPCSHEPMKKTLFILFLLGNTCLIFSQNIIEDATALMKAERLGETEDLVNRYCYKPRSMLTPL